METLIVIAPLIFLFVLVFYLRRKLFTRHLEKLSQLEQQKVLDKKDKDMRYTYLLFAFIIGQKLAFWDSNWSTILVIAPLIVGSIIFLIKKRNDKRKDTNYYRKSK